MSGVTHKALIDTQDRMDAYVRKGAATVDGWLARESAEVVSHLSVLQVRSNLKGGVGEIGIHHGKLFILLHLSLQTGEASFALDVFEEQEFNVDASGHGDRATFLQNFTKFGGDRERLTIFSTDSCSVSANELLSSTGPLRMLSVDGGHTEHITHNDMDLAEELLLEDGILILDDLYSERWPAVAAGVFRFLFEPCRALRPFAISPNKTYFCKSDDAAARYRSALGEAFPELRRGQAEILGRDVLILGRRTVANRVRNHPFVSQNPAVYQALSKIWRRLP